MKSIQQLIRKTLLCAALALMTSGTVRATWTEMPVSGITEGLYWTRGACDTSWGSYWCTGFSGKLYQIYWDGAAWKGVTVATNVDGNSNNCLVIDPVYHWTYYTGTDGYIWVAYWDGSLWKTVKVGQGANANYGAQFCYDTIYHGLWYVDQSGYLWGIYWNGAAWIEAKIDGVNKRYQFGRCCGMDSIYHIAWCLAENRKSMIATYYNGTAWVTGTGHGVLGGTDLYDSICVQESTHTVCNWQQNGTGTSTKGGYLHWTGGPAWLSATCFQDGNLPTSAGSFSSFCLPSPIPYCYHFCYATTGCRFTHWSTSARTWCSCRLDASTMGGGGLGLVHLCVGHGGRGILCTAPGGSPSDLPRMLWSDLP